MCDGIINEFHNGLLSTRSTGWDTILRNTAGGGGGAPVWGNRGPESPPCYVQAVLRSTAPFDEAKPGGRQVEATDYPKCSMGEYLLFLVSSFDEPGLSINRTWRREVI